MKIRTFIDRPILAGVISVVFLIIGLIGLSQLPVEQFPEIAPPYRQVFRPTILGPMRRQCRKV